MVLVINMKLGLCLAGGGVKGAAHIGAIKALEEKNVQIDCILGTSSGSIVAVLYASGYTSDEIKNIFEENAKKIKYIDFKRNIIDIVVRIIIRVFLIGPMGVLSGFIANKNFISYRLISIEFKNGNKSLVKIDNRTFKYFVQKVY